MVYEEHSSPGEAGDTRRRSALARNVMDACNPRTAQRAIAIAQADGAITSRKCRKSGDNTVLTAFVESSTGWGGSYRVSATVDEAAATLVDFACTCPASYQFDGPCKHCAALALAFAQNPDSFDGYAETRRSATSPALAEYLRRAERAMTLTDPGTVDFDVELTHAYGQWAARFRVAGPDGSYVIKDLAEFLQRMREGAAYSYGKKLAFAHVREAFAPRGQAIIAFLEQADAVRRESSKALWYASQPGIKGRELPLAEEEVVALIAALDEGECPAVAVESSDALSRRKSVASIVDGNPPLSVSIHPKVGGFVIEKSTPAQIFASKEGVVIWSDEAFCRCDASIAPCVDVLQAIVESSTENLFVSDADMPLFCATALPSLESCIQVDADESVNAFRPVPCCLEFYFDRSARFVTCDAYAVYGEKRYRIVDDALESSRASAGRTTSPADDAPAPLRDERAEAKGRALLRKFFRVEYVQDAARLDIEARIPANGDDALADLLFGGLTLFKGAGAVFTTPAFDRLISDRKPRVTMGVSLAGNLIDLTVSAEDLPADELAALLGSYRKRRRYHRLKSGAFLDLAEMNLADLDRIASDLDVSASQLATGSIELPAYRAFYLDEALHDARRDGSFKRYVEGFKAIDPARYRVPNSLAGILRPYQEEGFRWLSTLADMGFGGILADEMGLGKTLQLIAFLLDRQREAEEEGPSLIVCPASLVYNWTAELARFAPGLTVEPVAGPKRDRMASRARSSVDVFVTSYDLARIDAAEWSRIRLHCCVLDEAQYIKNHGTLTARAVKRLDAHHRFALTGTPMENRLSEIWSIFDFVMPGFLGSYMRFKERFELDIVGGDQDRARRLAALVGPFMLRRLKRDVLPDLPDKLESAVPVHMEPKQRKLYDACEQKLREELTAQHKDRKRNSELPPEQRRPAVEVLAELTRLRQICCDPRLAYDDYKGAGAKLDAICDLVESAANDGQKTLVFSQFTSFLDLIAQRLDADGVLYYTITGATPKRRRIALADAFNADDTPAFLISLKAGGTGLNLTGASVVVHADPWWNAAAQEQATDRAHRIGQERAVSVYRVIAEGTIEERIVRLQDQKAELAETIVGAEGISLANLTQDELLELLEG